MPDATGLLLHFVRCNAPPRFDAWRRWLEEIHLPGLRAIEGVRAATHWALEVQPEPGMPSVGFTHLIVLEICEALALTAERLRLHEDASRNSDRIDRSHCVIAQDRLRAHGRWRNKAMPTPQLEGHILAYVMCNDPRREAEWDRWNDDVHMPDMLGSGAFTGLSRWERDPRAERGTNHVTLYDVGEGGVRSAVARSAAVMPGLVEAGRKHEAHVGGLTITLVRP